MEHCEQCGFVYADVNALTLPTRLAAFGPRYQERLWPLERVATWPETLRQRPAPTVWSALEYACHVRDVFLVQRDRLYLVLVEDTPAMTPMYRDDRVTLARYNAQEPAEVVAQLTMAAQLIAQAFAVLDTTQLARTCRYNFPAPAVRSLLWVGQHVVHEGEHHLQDIAQVLASVGRTAPESLAP
jgi:S-DNA-T family DNA segregation ATPase FtsK/SpoIIIE